MSFPMVNAHFLVVLGGNRAIASGDGAVPIGVGELRVLCVTSRNRCRKLRSLSEPRGWAFPLVRYPTNRTRPIRGRRSDQGPAIQSLCG
ncbi:hypothetical protein BDB13_5809 [Rhodococcus sp. OK302]|nr:hypothetical protein BDB13_5809 [Rhodococcus sp. OK302]